MGPHGARSLQEIVNWGPCSDLTAELVGRICEELIEAGELTESIDAQGTVIYRKATKEA